MRKAKAVYKKIITNYKEITDPTYTFFSDVLSGEITGDELVQVAQVDVFEKGQEVIEHLLVCGVYLENNYNFCSCKNLSLQSREKIGANLEKYFGKDVSFLLDGDIGREKVFVYSKQEDSFLFSVACAVAEAKLCRYWDVSEVFTIEFTPINETIVLSQQVIDGIRYFFQH